MAKYTWTQHTPGHIAIPEMDKGKAKMFVPDPADVKAASETNAQHDAAMRRALKQTMQAQNKAKNLIVPEAILDAQVAAAKIAPKVRVPITTAIVKDTVLSFEEEYELPEDNEQIKNYVASGYLKAVEKPAAPAANTETK